MDLVVERPGEGVYRYTLPGCRENPDNCLLMDLAAGKTWTRCLLMDLVNIATEEYGNRGGAVECACRNECGNRRKLRN